MGRYLTKTALLGFTPILLLHLLISSTLGASVNSTENRVYISKEEGRSLLYESEGKPPKSIDQNLCKLFHEKTCCSASLAVENLATYGETDKDCLELFELLECSICHPNVGIQSETPRVCASFCDRVLKACSIAYLSNNAFSDFEQVIIPRGATEDITFGKDSKCESNGTVLSNASLMETGSSEEKTESFEWFRDLPEMIYEVEIIEIEMWVHSILIKGVNHFIRWLTQQGILARFQRYARRV